MTVSIFCKHKWRVLDKTVKPSNLEHMVALGLRPSEWTVADVTSKTIIICCCEKCGKIKKYTA